MTPDPRIAARKQRWLDFYDLARPHRDLLIIHYLPELGPRPFPRMDNLSARIEWARQRYELEMARMDWLEDDSIPCLDVYTGTEIFAAAFGCPVYYPHDNMPFAQPIVRSVEEAAALRVPGLDAPPIAALFHIADELRRRAPDALVHMVDIQSPMDIAALIWDKLTFYPAMVENPQAVRALAEKVHGFLVCFLDAWFSQYGRQFIAHYPDYYMPYGITLSEDEIGAVSPKIFNELFLPELAALSERYGMIGMHCCATARHQWANFKRIPNLKLLNLNQPGPVIRESLAYFSEVATQWPIPQGGELPYDTPEHAQARVVREFWPETKEEAQAISEQYLI